MPVIDAGPEIGLVEFPEGMSDEEMSRELSKEAMRIEQRALERSNTRMEVAEGALDVAENLVRGASGEPIGRALRDTGNVVAGLARDVGGYIRRGEIPGMNRPVDLENTGAALVGKPLPADERDEAILRETEGLSGAGRDAASVRLGMTDAARSVPVVAGSMALTAAGVPAPVAFGVPMAVQTAAEADDPVARAKSLAIGAAIPGVAAIGRRAAGAGLKEAVKGGWLSENATIGQKMVETLASQAAVQGLVELSNLPTYAQMTPEERRGALIRSMAANLAFGVMDLPAFKSGVPSETQTQLVRDAEFMVSQLLEKGPILSLPPEQLALMAADPRMAQMVVEPLKGETTNEHESTRMGEGEQTERRKGVWEASTPVAGERVRGIWRVMDAGELVTSSDAGFDQALQPRDRTREASVAQIADMAARLDPERLGEAPTTDLGAPVVDERNQVLSGNGRVGALRSAAPESATGYREFISRKAQELGLPAGEIAAIGKLRNPVLVRQVTDLGKLSKEEFARQSNQQQVLGMGEAEKAASDARVVEKLMEVWRPSEDGDVMAASNREFLTGFVKGTGDAAELLTKEGFNTGAMTRRVKNAVLGSVVGGDARGRELLGALLERGEELGVKNVVNGVMQAAPGLVRLGGDYDVRPVLSKALRDLVKIRTEGLKVEDYTRQMDLLADPERSIETDFVLSQLAKAKGAKGVSEALMKYAERVKHETAKTAGDMFGELPRTRSELLQEVFQNTKSQIPNAKQGEFTTNNSPLRPTKSTKGTKRGKGADLVPATIEQATLPRRVESDTTAPATTEPVSLAEIRQYLSTALDIPVRARRYGKRALGIFRQNPETIRMKALNDIPTLAHEVGHYLHALLFPDVAGMAAGGGTAGPRPLIKKTGEGFNDFSGRFDGELLGLGARTSRGSYTQQQVRMEGVAEFVREWMTDRSKALAKAPGFTQFFEGELAGKFPEVWKIVSTAREQLGRYINQPAMVKVRSRISRNAPERRFSMREFWHEQVTGWFDDLHPIERSLKQLQTFGLPANQAQMVNDLAVNYIGGWRGKVEHTLRWRQTDLDGRDVGPSLRQILGGIKDVTEFGDYLVAKRELELLGRGIKTGMDPRDAVEQRRAVALLDQQYGAKAKALYEFQRNQVQLLVDSGVISKEAAAKMALANEFYVPFYRMMEGIDGPRASGGKAGQGFVDLGTGIYSIKGSDRTYLDPLESVIKNAYLFRDLAERNRVARHFVEAVETVRGGGRVAEGITAKVKPVKFGGEEIERALMKEWEAQMQARGVTMPAATQMPDLSAMAFTLWRAARQSNPREGIFTVWENGKQKVYQLSDPELYRALTLADRTDGRMFQNIFWKALRAPAAVLRTGATHTLEFMARNPLRDQWTAAVYSKHGFVPIFDGVRGIFSAIGKDQWYQDWVKAGGKYSEMVAVDRAGLQEQLKDLNPTLRQEALRLLNPLNIIKHLQSVSMVMEQATRISEYRRAVKAGASPMEAANAAKDVTLNFARAGVHGKTLNQITAFFNAAVQDGSKFLRAHQERPVETAMKGFMYITLPTLMAWWLGKDDEKIQNLPAWRKMVAWNINVGKMTGGEDFVISFPKPIGLLGWVYANGPEAALNYALGKDPNAVNKWMSGLIESQPMLSPLHALAGNFQKAVEPWIPTAAVPVVEGMGNRSLFRDAPIESEAMRRLPAYLRYEPQTSMVARELGRLAPFEGGSSPVMIDNGIRRLLGGLGKYGTDAIDWAALQLNAEELPAPPAKGWSERPLLRAFVGSPHEASAFVERFYDGVEAADRRVAEFKALAKIEEEGARAFLEKNKEALVWYEMAAGGKTMLERAHKTRDDLSEVLKAMRTVQGDKAMSGEQKRAALQQLSRLRDELAQAGFEAFLAPGDRKKVF